MGFTGLSISVAHDYNSLEKLLTDDFATLTSLNSKLLSMATAQIF